MVNINGNTYTLARDEDFEVRAEKYYSSYNYYFKYIGSAPYVLIPETIRGYAPLNYDGMFEGTAVQGVASSPYKATTMKNMFKNTTSLVLDLTGLNTKNITNMAGMFDGCGAIDLKINKFNTSNVRDMRRMFKDAKAVRLDLRNFNTGSVYHMMGMFQNAQARIIDVSSFDTSKVRNMDAMFEGTQAEELDVGNFDTRSVRPYYSQSERESDGGMRYMFKNSKAKTLDLSSFTIAPHYYQVIPRDLRYFVHFIGMFDGAAATEIKVNSMVPDSGSRSDVNHFSFMADMFRNTQVETLDLSSFEIKSGFLWLGGEDLNEFLTGSTAKKVYVKNFTTVRAIRNSKNLPDDIEIVVGGEGYIPAAVRPPITPIDPGDSLIDRIEKEKAKQSVLPYKALRRANRTKKETYEELVQEGVDGVRKEQYATYYMLDGTSKRVLIFEEEKVAVNEITEYGTIVSEETEKVAEEYDFETHYYNDYEATAGERVQQRGVKGFLKQTYTIITHTDGKNERILKEEKKEEPVDQIIAIGMIERKNAITKDEAIPFQTVTTYDDNRPYNNGEPHVLERGKEGNIRRTYDVITYTDDTEQLWKLIPEKTVSEDPKTERLVIGLIDYTTKKEDPEGGKVLSFGKPVYQYNKDLLEGEEHLLQQGVNGLEIRVYDITYYVPHPLTGEKKSPLKVERREDYKYTAPVPHIIEKGAKNPIKDDKTFDVKNKVVRFETEYIDDPTLYVGQERVVREGINGTKEDKYQILTYFDDTTERIHLYTKETPAINKLVKRGTKDPVIKKEKETEVSPIAYETVRIKTNALAPGIERIKRPGVNGSITRTYEKETRWDGAATRNLINEERIEPVNALVEIGTDEVIVTQVEETTTLAIPFETKQEKTDALYVGETQIKTYGQDGVTRHTYIVTTYKNGTIDRTLISSITTPPTHQVILIGTRREGVVGPLTDIEGLNRSMTGGWLFLEDGDTNVRCTVKTKIRPKWGYL